MFYPLNYKPLLVVPAGIKPILPEPRSGVLSTIVVCNTLSSNYDAKISQIFITTKYFPHYFHGTSIIYLMKGVVDIAKKKERDH